LIENSNLFNFDWSRDKNASNSGFGIGLKEEKLIFGVFGKKESI